MLISRLQPRSAHSESLGVAEPELVDCIHCGAEVALNRAAVACTEDVERYFCCHGCLSAHQYIHSNGLADFYRRRQQFDSNINQPRAAVNESKSDWRFLDHPEASQDYLQTASNGDRYVRIQVGGMYCPSCSWLLEKALSDISDGVSASVDFTSHTIDIVVTDDRVRISALFELIENLGYRPGLPLEQVSQGDERKRQSRDALKRICVAGLGMMQVMTYAIAAYLGEFQGMDAAHLQFLTLISMLVATVVVFYAGRQIFVNAVTDLANARLGMDVPIAIAILGAYVPSVVFSLQANYQHVYFDSAVMFVFFILVTRFVEANARGKLNPIDLSTELAVNPVAILREGETQYVLPAEVCEGDEALIGANQRLLFDGRVCSESVLVDESNITGESEPQLRVSGDQVLAGAKVLGAQARFVALTDWEGSSAARLRQMLVRSRIKGASARQADNSATRFFVLFTLLLTSAVALLWWWFSPGRTLEIALAMLVASCPCAFALAEPLAVTAAVAKLRRAGVWIADFSALSGITQSCVWAFDKTGTLTQGRPQIQKVHTLSEASESDVRAIAAALLIGEEHPFALAFNNAGQAGNSPVATKVESVPGIGVCGYLGEQKLWLGRPEWVKTHVKKASHQLDTICQLSANSLVALADESGCLALFELADAVRPAAKNVIHELKQGGAKVAILSGDRGAPVRLCGIEAGVDQSFPELLPQQKKAMIHAWQAHGEKVVMVGDGSNDAPALSSADVAIAMMNGASVAQSQADVLLMNGRLGALLGLVETAQKMVRIINQNRRWALFYNVLALPLAAAGYLSPWLAVTGMSVSSLLVVLNASRLAR